MPNFFVVGAGKAGTTSLYHYLGTHPQLFMCRIKEPNYFCKDSKVSASINWDDYLRLFRGVRDEPAIGECSVLYLSSACAARSIRAAVPNAKIIVILRNPVDRGYSHFLMGVRQGFPCQNVLDLPDYVVDLGLYYAQVKRYLDEFPNQQIHILFHEDLQRDREAFVKRMFGFLNVDDGFRPPNLEKHFNEALEPRFKVLNGLFYKTGLVVGLRRFVRPEIKEAMRAALFKAPREQRSSKLTPNERQTLVRVFEPDIHRLEALLSRDLSHWLR